MVDTIFFTICLAGLCFSCMCLGWCIGEKDGYNKAKKRFKPLLNMCYGRGGYTYVDTDIMKGANKND